MGRWDILHTQVQSDSGYKHVENVQFPESLTNLLEIWLTASASFPKMQRNANLEIRFAV